MSSMVGGELLSRDGDIAANERRRSTAPWTSVPQSGVCCSLILYMRVEALPVRLTSSTTPTPPTSAVSNGWRSTRSVILLPAEVVIAIFKTTSG